MRYLSLIALCCLLLAGIAVRPHAQEPTDWTKADKAGTFTVPPGQWLGTGITVSKGQRFLVAATGTLKYKEYPFTEIGPNGGAFGFYSLKGYIDPSNSSGGGQVQFMVLGSQGVGTALADGKLHLGVTRSNYFAANPSHPEDQGLTGSFEVTVYLEKVTVYTAARPRPVTKGPVKLIKLDGEANFLPPGADWQEAFEGMRLDAQDEIHTGPDSEATLLFPDGSTVVVHELSRIRMGGLLKEDTRFKIEILMKMGEISAKVKPQEVIGSGFSVRTPTATAGVRGTVFTTRFDEKTQTATVSVTEGSVLVTPTNTAHQPVMLRANQEVEVAQNSVSAIRPVGSQLQKLVWQRVGAGDCGGRDVGASDGPTPDNNQAREGYTAVCWDGRSYISNGGRVWCTYKQVATEQCTGGGNPGIMYKAVRVAGGAN